MATKTTKKKASAPVVEATTEKKTGRSKGTRFLGWQKTPFTQSAYGRSTQGGKGNQEFKVLASTGSVQTTQPRWYLVDASEAPVGRVATTIASILMGKYRSTFTPGAGTGDAVIVINADKAYFTSNKAEQKIYYDHSRFMGGLKSETGDKLLKRKPEKVIWLAVQGMMPKNKISRYQLSLLKIVRGAEHEHQAQKPIQVSLKKMLKKIPMAVGGN
jgi:large subunit ribosomal protein L13